MLTSQMGQRDSSSHGTHVQYYKIKLYRWQQEYLNKMLPQGISLQQKHWKGQFELSQLNRCKELKNVNAESEKLYKQSLLVLKGGESTSDYNTMNKCLIEVPVKKKELALQLVSKLKQMLKGSFPNIIVFEQEWEELEQKVKKKWRCKYDILFKYLWDLATKIKLSNSLNDDEVFNQINKEIKKTKDIFSMFKCKPKLYLLKEVELPKERENNSNNGVQIRTENHEVQQKQSKRDKLKAKTEQKRKNKALKYTNEQLMTFSSTIEASQSQIQTHQIITADETIKIVDELKKLNQSDQYKLLNQLTNQLTNSKLTGLLGSLKREEAIFFLAKIKQTIRRKSEIQQPQKKRVFEDSSDSE